jgi:hypothetical protein
VGRGAGVGAEAVAAPSGEGVAAGEGELGARDGAGERAGVGVALGLAVAGRGVTGTGACARGGRACGGEATARIGEGEGPGGAASGSRFVTYEIAAPIAKPTRITAIIAGISGKVGSVRRRRGGGMRLRIPRSFACARRGASHVKNTRTRQEARTPTAKRTRVIRLAIPVDVNTVAATACDVFALATPLRVDQLLALAIGEAIGARAPADKRERTIRRALASFRAGDFLIDIDGRVHDRPDTIAVCSGTITVRFYSNETRRSRLNAS